MQILVPHIMMVMVPSIINIWCYDRESFSSSLSSDSTSIIKKLKWITLIPRAHQTISPMSFVANRVAHQATDCVMGSGYICIKCAHNLFVNHGSYPMPPCTIEIHVYLYIKAAIRLLSRTCMFVTETSM